MLSKQFIIVFSITFYGKVL